MQRWRLAASVAAASAIVAALLVGVGSYLGGVDFTTLGFGLGAGAVVVSAPLVALASLSRSTPRWVAIIGAVLFGGGVVFAASPFFSHELRLHAFERAAQRSRPLVSAIRSFEQLNGRPPETLAQLVPTHLESVPTTGIWTHPRFTYEVEHPSAPASNSTWRLSIELSMDQFDFDPYGHTKTGPSTRRLGDWTYHFW
jgi:hypothetical protein